MNKIKKKSCSQIINEQNKKKSCSPQMINEQNKKNWMWQPLDMGIKRMLFISLGWFQPYFMKSESDQYCGRYFCFSSIQI